MRQCYDPEKIFMPYVAEETWHLPRVMGRKDSKLLLEQVGFRVLGASGCRYDTIPPQGWSYSLGHQESFTSQVLNLTDEEGRVRLRLIYLFLTGQLLLEPPTWYQQLALKMRRRYPRIRSIV